MTALKVKSVEVLMGISPAVHLTDFYVSIQISMPCILPSGFIIPETKCIKVPMPRKGVVTIEYLTMVSVKIGKACGFMRLNLYKDILKDAVNSFMRTWSEPRTNDEKIKKLLALSKSSNVHEAKVALGKAHKLMEKY